MKKIVSTAFIVTFLQGCSFLNPYDSESMCAGLQDYGDCVPVEEAYKQAVSGKKRVIKTGNEVEEGEEPSRIIAEQTDELGEYQRSYFERLKKVIEEPQAPLIKQPKAIRGLILPYGKKTLYTARHVYIMVEDPTFILGDYMARPKQKFRTSLINPIK